MDADELRLEYFNHLEPAQQQHLSLMVLAAAWGNSAGRASYQAIHPDLIAVALRAREISQIPFVFIRGLRTEEEQKEYVSKGWSQTYFSNHMIGRAIDVAPVIDGKVVEGESYKHYYEHVALAFKIASRQLGIEVQWGGHQKFVDFPHFQLPENYEAQRYSIKQAADKLAQAFQAIPARGRIQKFAAKTVIARSPLIAAFSQ